MRRYVWLFVVVVFLLVGFVPTAQAISLVPTFIFSVRDGKVESRYLVRFVGSQSGELTPTGNTLRPRPGEDVRCQVLQVHAGVHLRDFHFQFSCMATPQRGDWTPFTSDDAYGHIGELGQFMPAPGGLATPLRFRLTVKNGESHEVRIFGFKEPIINGLMSLLGMSHDNFVEYSLLYVVPSNPAQDSSSATITTMDGSQFADAKATTENFRRTAEAFGKVQEQVAKAIEGLNLNDTAITRQLDVETARNDTQDVRLARLESWASSVAGTQVLVPPTAPTTATAPTPPAVATKCNWRLNLPTGVIAKIETLDHRGERSYDGRWAKFIPMNNYAPGAMCVRLTWEGRDKPDQWKIVNVSDGLAVDYLKLEVR